MSTSLFSRPSVGKARFRYLAAFLSLCFQAVSCLAGQSFDCESAACNLGSHDTYPHIVLGTTRAVATDDQARRVYRWARSQGYWPGLPDNEDQFIELVQILSIEVPGERGVRELTLLMAREEYDTSPLVPGDYVRYTPHTVDEPRTPLYAEPVARKYWDLFGCIAPLCRADDGSCPSQYISGIYRFEDGRRLDRVASAPGRRAMRIDTQTYLPLPEPAQP